MTNKDSPKMKSQKYARQAIQTRFLGPTNHKGSRIKAFAQAGSVTVSKDYGLTEYEEHERAAIALCDKFKWPGTLRAGCLPNGDYCWVLIEGDSE
jgi:hypothetical protein